MSQPLLHMGATVLCMHAGQATPTAPQSRVTVSGQPVVPMSSMYTVAGCTLPPPPAGNGPCVSANYVTSATRVSSMGMPLLLITSQAVCVPTGTGLNTVASQVRVTAV